MTDDQNNKSEEKIDKIIPSLLKGKGKKLWDLLWDHQKEALTRMMDYIDKYHNDFTNKSALVQMPTGSGKSGVITVLSTCISEIGLTLVLTPRKSLRNQLYEDIRGRFFAHISYPSENLPKNIIIIIINTRLELISLEVARELHEFDKTENRDMVKVEREI